MHFYEQRLDHFNSSDMRIFQQKYYMNRIFYKAGLGAH